MCLYIFSPDRSIQIQYASETITFIDKRIKNYRLLTHLIIDLLIKNNTNTELSDKEISELYLIYPRDFFYADYSGDGVFNMVPTSDIYDATLTFMDEKHNYNRFLNDSPCKMTRNGYDLELTQPNPTVTGEFFKYKGVINNSNIDIEAIDDISDLQWYILMNLRRPKFTIFKLNLQNNSIKSEESRWFRFRVEGPENKPTFKERVILAKDKIVDRPITKYKIIGPHDVLDSLKSSLEIFIAKPPQELAYSKDLTCQANDLLEKILKLTQNATVKINDWRINILPMDYWELENINNSGNIRKTDTFPNVISKLAGEFKNAVCYQWVTGNQYFREHKNYSGRLQINFQIIDRNYLIKFLPWIALLVGVVALFIALIPYFGIIIHKLNFF